LANRMVWQLNRGFYGVGCPHPGVEAMTLQLTKLLTHYGCDTAVGRLLQVSWELLTIELGMGGQPFRVDFRKYGGWVTESLIKSVWEKVFLFGIVVEEGKLQLEPPREWDEWLMPLFVQLRFEPQESGSSISLRCDGRKGNHC
jgi:hypothetical protein